MQIKDISLPSKIQAITVDLWDTLFYDSDYFDILNNMRVSIIEDVLKEKKILIKYPVMDAFKIERQRYQSYEREGIFLPFEERIGFITDYKLSHDEITSISKRFDSVALAFYPKIREDLLNQLKQWKAKYKLALISNTGMTSSFVIKEFLNKYGIYELFDEIIFSGDVHLCKPDKKIFHLASRRFHLPVSHILHIGDSLVFDFNAAKNAGFYAIRIKKNEYFKSW